MIDGNSGDFFYVGKIVWAKLGSSRWWPAMIIDGKDCGRLPALDCKAWIFWFGDHTISELSLKKLLDFVEFFSSKYSMLGSKSFKQGIIEAITELFIRAGFSSFSGEIELIKWAENGFHGFKYNRGSYNIGDPYSEKVKFHLKKLRSYQAKSLRFDDDYEKSTSSKIRLFEGCESSIRKVKHGLLNIKDLCIACDSVDVGVLHEHPLFEGGLCDECKDGLVDTMFAYDDDGANAFCVICGNPGVLLICDNYDCKRCYCNVCIETLVSVEAWKRAETMQFWECYLCNISGDFGLLKPRVDWHKNIFALFQPKNGIQVPNIEPNTKKNPIRVLSIFDGIGTCKLVLEQLGLETADYFASEIDHDAINVCTSKFEDKIKQLGDVEDLSDSQIAKLCPLDLVVGGSPCNDLSLVNPARKGPYDPTGTGRLFFDFFRILRAVQFANKGKHVFWLFENVASMPLEYRKTINRFLQCEPCLVDAKFFSPQNRARFFWGNIPGMYSPLQPHVTEQMINLNDLLMPFMNRVAQVEKVRTVTTRGNSLKQGKIGLYPVLMNGENDLIWITELEKIFGFPTHYTDVGNISLGRRHQLLGKAWSVPVIKHLLFPLTKFFKTTNCG